MPIKTEFLLEILYLQNQSGSRSNSGPRSNSGSRSNSKSRSYFGSRSNFGSRLNSGSRSMSVCVWLYEARWSLVNVCVCVWGCLCWRLYRINSLINTVLDDKNSSNQAIKQAGKVNNIKELKKKKKRRNK